MRICFAAGGTAGHIYPAIAMAEIIKSKYPTADFLFFSTPQGMENAIYEAYGYTKHPIVIHGIKRSLSPKNIRLLFEIPKAIKECKTIMRAFQPQLVIGTGGYICYPVIQAARRLHIPTALHESNAVPGLVVRALANKTDHLLVSMEEAKKYFPKHPSCHHVGTPLRSNFQMATKYAAREKLSISQNAFFILSFGGSLGARALNEAFLSIMEEYANTKEKIVWFHATGKEHYDGIVRRQSGVLNTCSNFRIMPYIEDMATHMAAADIIICRSGASTLAELSTLGKPSILVPYPYAAKQHQLLNARCMERLGGAVIVEEGDNLKPRLSNAIEMLRDDPQLRTQMGIRAKLLQGKDVPFKILQSLEI